MKLNFEAYRDSVHACWIGKNIGGTMGAPYEGKREMQDISGFATKPGEVLPNDDLDLQLIWLNAAERYGLKHLDARVLGEFWESFITPHWNEYGIGKANMKQGLLPPLSGDYQNDWRNSNGAWIRTEIWASIFPGRPDFAAHYAIADACVDHGTGEGTYAAAFVAAMQSSAFAIKDLACCIEIGLSKIPAECRVAKSVRLALDCHRNGMSLVDARNCIQQSNADLGSGWFEAPSNVGYTVLGLLYGEGDFKKSMIYAINCGDDTDCTGATVGSTLGILGGTKAIPADWREYIGDEIVTICIATGTIAFDIPKTCEALTERTARLARIAASEPFLYPVHANGWQPLEFTDGESSFAADEVIRGKDVTPQNVAEHLMLCPLVRDQLAETPENSFTQDFTFCHVTVSLPDGADICPGDERRVRVRIVNNWMVTGNIPHNLSLRWLLPEGFTVSGGKSHVSLRHHADHATHNIGAETVEFVVRAEKTAPINRLVLEIVGDGRPTPCYLSVVMPG